MFVLLCFGVLRLILGILEVIVFEDKREGGGGGREKGRGVGEGVKNR